MASMSPLIARSPLFSWLADPTLTPELDTRQPVYLSLALIFACVSCFRALTANGDNIPCLSSPIPWIFGKGGKGSIALENFQSNARGLMAQGRNRFPEQPFKMMADSLEIVILPFGMIDDIRNEPGLSFMGPLVEDFHTHLPGFEPFSLATRDDSLIQVVVRKQLTKLLDKVTEPLSQEASYAAETSFSLSPEWKKYTLKTEILDMVARLSSRVFLGPEICRREDWLSITKSYTIHGFLAAEELRRYSPIWRRLVNQFLPECRLVRKQIAEARSIIGPVIKERRDNQDGNLTAFNDALSWFEDESRGNTYDAAASQLGLSTAAIHTTTDLLTEVLLNIAQQHSDLLADLRREICQVLRADGWKKTSLFNLKLLDSVIKESQRMRPIAMTSMMRTATQDVHLPNGMILRQGQRVAVDTAQMRDAALYPDPDVFDGYRFVRMRDEPGRENQAYLVSTGPASVGFGHGTHACPGRFFAANEIKVALCHLLIKYDWGIAPGCEPRAMEHGFMWSVDMNAQVLVRRRQPELDIDAL